MRADSRQAIHVGVNFVFVPPPTLDKNAHVKLQQALGAEGIEYTDCGRAANFFTILRTTAPVLQVRIAALPPAPVAQLVIESPGPGVDRDYFCKEAEAVVQAFNATWPDERRQILSVDATLRDLFESSSNHAFAEIWQERLGREPSEFESLGPVSGGGFRLVIAPSPADPEPLMIEIAIESFLQDPKKILLTASFKWLKPHEPGAPIQPSDYITRANNYVREKLLPFMNKGVSNDASG